MSDTYEDLLEACRKAEAGISDWRLGAQSKDRDGYCQMTAAEPYLRSVLDSLRSAIVKAEAIPFLRRGA